MGERTFTVAESRLNPLYEVNNVKLTLPYADENAVVPFMFTDQDNTKFSARGKMTGIFPGDYKHDSEIVWSIYVPTKITGTYAFAGRVMLTLIDWLARSADLSIFIDNEFHKQGHGKIACDKMIAHAFLKLGLNRISCGTPVSNLGMRKIAESLGFQLEGISREAMYLMGHFINVNRYGLLRSEWE